MSDNKAIIEDFLSHNGVTDAELAHFGVKGMRWGVRRGENQTGGSGRQSRKELRKERDSQIENARETVRQKSIELESQAFKTYTAKTHAGRVAATKAYDRMSAEIANSPEYATASKMTSQEKRVVGSVLAMYGGATVALIALSKVGS